MPHDERRTTNNELWTTNVTWRRMDIDWSQQPAGLDSVGIQAGKFTRNIVQINKIIVAFQIIIILVNP